MCRVRPTWVGTRPYTTTDGRVVRVLRRPSQVNAPGHLETLKRVVGTRRHPERDGRPVFLSVDAEPGSVAPWDEGVELRPPRDYFAAAVGDAIELVRVPGLGEVPELCATVNDRETIADIERGLVEVSYGYVSYFVPAADVPVDGDEVPAVGKWRNPETGAVEDFDLEGLCDPTDPRVPDELRAYIGGNHLAFAVPRGRGGPDIRVMLDSLDATVGGAADVVGLPALGRNVRAWGLLRKVDESGKSGTGLVAVAFDVEGGMCGAIWATPTMSVAAYSDLDTFVAIHIGNHAPDANELIPLVLAAPLHTPQQPAPEPDPEEETMPEPTQPNPPAPQPAPNKDAPPAPPTGPTVEQLQAENTALKAKVAELTAQLQQLQQEKSAADKAASDAKEAAGKAEAKADALAEELAPFRTEALRRDREAYREILGAAEDDEVGKAISAATADALPAVVVGSYYKANPERAAAVADLERKLKDPAWCRGRAEALREQGPAPSRGVSDGFRESFRHKTPAPATDNANDSPQAELDRLQGKGK